MRYPALNEVVAALFEVQLAPRCSGVHIQGTAQQDICDRISMVDCAAMLASVALTLPWLLIA